MHVLQTKEGSDSCQTHEHAPECGSFDDDGWSSGCGPVPCVALLPLLLLTRRRMWRSALLRRRKEAELPAARMRREAAAGWLEPPPGVWCVAREERVEWPPLASALGGDLSEGEDVPMLGLFMACTAQRTSNRLQYYCTCENFGTAGSDGMYFPAVAALAADAVSGLPRLQARATNDAHARMHLIVQHAENW